MADVAQAPKREKVARGHYVSSDEDGVVYDIKQHPIHKDWDVRDSDGSLHFRDAYLSEALNSIALMHEDEAS